MLGHIPINYWRTIIVTHEIQTRYVFGVSASLSNCKQKCCDIWFVSLILIALSNSRNDPFTTCYFTYKFLLIDKILTSVITSWRNRKGGFLRRAWVRRGRLTKQLSPCNNFCVVSQYSIASSIHNSSFNHVTAIIVSCPLKVVIEPHVLPIPCLTLPHGFLILRWETLAPWVFYPSDNVVVKEK